MNAEIKAYKRQALAAAKDFKYGKHVEDRIKNAKSVGDIDRIMRKARHEKFGE